MQDNTNPSLTHAHYKPDPEELRYLKVLSELFPDIPSAATEIINLQSILNLPKGTEHYISDIHGEFAAFSHVVKNGSGSVRKKIDDVFGHTLDNQTKRSLATLIYYPEEKMALVRKKETDLDNWYHITLYRLIEICKVAASKYTRSRVRKVLPPEYAYVIEELITEKPEVLNKESYYDAIVNSIIETNQAESFIRALCRLIQKLVIDRIHIVGDIFDRGSEPHRVMDLLMSCRSVDIQWGNHDILWMGAAAGSPACIANVIRNCAKYGNLDVLEDGYGINILPLVTFAIHAYTHDPCDGFAVDKKYQTVREGRTDVKTHKAIFIIQMKLEGQLIRRHPEFGMDDRLLLDKIDPEKKTVRIDGKDHPICLDNFPTIDWSDPYRLTEDEAEIVERLQNAFLQCEKLQKHCRFLLDKGGIYKVCNRNLLFHGCMPLTEDGQLREVNIYGKAFKGKALMDVLERFIRRAFTSNEEEEIGRSRDLIWFIWCHPGSPLFGKDKMATFERYFTTDKALHAEKKDPYYTYQEDPETVDRILADFGLEGPETHIINGHVPVKFKDGESPIKCGGKVCVIDGGFSTAYQKVTGLAGYTLIYNSYGMFLAAHEPFVTTDVAIREEADIISSKETVYLAPRRLLISDTDEGKKLAERIEDLKKLLKAYRAGVIRESGKPLRV